MVQPCAPFGYIASEEEEAKSTAFGEGAGTAFGGGLKSDAVLIRPRVSVDEPSISQLSVETPSLNRLDIETPETPSLQRPEVDATTPGPKPEAEAPISTPKPDAEVTTSGPKPDADVERINSGDVSTSQQTGTGELVPSGGKTDVKESVSEPVTTTGKETGEAERGGLNLFKWKDKTSLMELGWKEGDYFLYLPDKGSPRANWKQNSGRLRQQMREGKPIYDSYRKSNGDLIEAQGFLKAERNLLKSKGWQYDSKSGAWHPLKSDVPLPKSLDQTSSSVAQRASPKPSDPLWTSTKSKTSLENAYGHWGET